MILQKMEKNWTKVFTSKDNFLVDLLISILKEEGIHAVALNTKDSSYLTFGIIELFVKEKDAVNSRKIIKIYNE